MTEIEVRDPSGPLQQTAFQAIVQQAEIIANTAIVPRQYAGKPDDIIAAGILGAELGFGLMTALRYINVVQGKPELSTEAKVALARRAGHSITGESSSTEARAVGKRSDNGDEMTVVYTIEDAQQAGLAKGNVWRSHPAAMLWARAVSTLMRRLMPDVALGGYAEGEISGADTFETVEAAPSIVYASEEDLATITTTIGELDDAQKAELREWWQANQIPASGGGQFPASAVPVVLEKLDGLMGADVVVDAEVVDEGWISEAEQVSG